MSKRIVFLMMLLCVVLFIVACSEHATDKISDNTATTEVDTIILDTDDSSATEKQVPDTQAASVEIDAEPSETSDIPHYIIPTDTTQYTPDTERQSTNTEKQPDEPNADNAFCKAIRGLGVKTIEGDTWVLYSTADIKDGSRTVLVMKNKKDKSASVRAEYKYDPKTHRLNKVMESDDMPVGTVDECIYVILGDYEVFWK